jgi:hypothetical protein
MTANVHLSQCDLPAARKVSSSLNIRARTPRFHFDPHDLAAPITWNDGGRSHLLVALSNVGIEQAQSRDLRSPAKVRGVVETFV